MTVPEELKDVATNCINLEEFKKYQDKILTDMGGFDPVQDYGYYRGQFLALLKIYDASKEQVENFIKMGWYHSSLQDAVEEFDSSSMVQEYERSL